MTARNQRHLHNDLRRWMRLVESDELTARAHDIMLSWVNGERYYDDKWAALFASVKPILDETKPHVATCLFRNERVNDDTQYDRFTSWSTDREIAADYPSGGGRNRQVIWAMIEPADMICFVPAFGPKVNWLNQQEMIVKPGHYHRVPIE